MLIGIPSTIDNSSENAIKDLNFTTRGKLNTITFEV